MIKEGFQRIEGGFKAGSLFDVCTPYITFTSGKQV